MSAEGGLTTAGYIQHHLTNLAVCSDAARDATGHCHGFWSFHLDTEVKQAEVKEEFDRVLSVMPWEMIDLKNCTREEISTVLIPRFYADKGKMPTLVNALQNALSLEENVTMQAFTMSRRERMELKKKDTVIALSKEIKPILSTKADDFVDLFKNLALQPMEKRKSPFLSLSRLVIVWARNTISFPFLYN